MKKAKSILAFLVSIGMIMPNLSQVYAQESNDYGVVGAYEAYSIAENLYEQGKKVKTGNEMIRIRKNPKGGSKEVGEIAYCFNADRAVPDIQGATPDFTGEDYPEDTLITYTKVAGTASKFSSLAVHARENARNAILKVMYNGFRDGDANRVDEIKNAFKAKYPNGEEGNISDAELYAATQKAIWYYTDSQELATQKPSEAKIEGDEIDATMNTKTWYVYQFLLGQALTDDNPLKGMTLNEVQGNNTLDLYKPARSHQLHNKGYQNLLSSKFVTSNTETKYSEFDVKIKKIDKDGNSILANARLKLEAVNNGSSDQRLFMWTTKEDGGLNPTTFKLPAGEYLLTELSAPEGYKLAEPITVKVSATGEVTYNIKNKAETTTPSDKTVVMVNEKTDTMTVNVNKEWKDKNDGIPSDLDFLTTKVKLMADGKDAVDASGHAVPEQLLSKGNQWKASFKNLPIYKNGTNSGEKIVYTVSESEIDGYKLIQGGDTKVSGNADKDIKDIQLVNKETDTSEPEQTPITKVQVNKKWSNQDKKSSKDIYFELWKVKDGSESVVAPADFASMPKAFQARQKLPSNGTMVIWNKLYLKEQGYTFKVKEVDESGNAWQDKANGYKEGSAKIESNVDKAQQLLVFDVTNNYEEVAKTKVNFSKKALTENGKELAGATIKLTKEDGSIVKEWTTDGSVTEFELENGIYTFTEVSAPDKYQVATAITFEVKDGKVTVKGTEVSGNTVVMVDKLIEVAKTKVNFSKKALTENGKELAGATIKLTKEDGSIVKEWTTDGSVTEFELENGIYTFTEVSAPDKYQVATAITFEVKDGKVNVKGTEVSGNTVVMVDQLKEAPKTKVNFSKKALTENGKELAGATIKLTKEDGSIVKEWTTDGSVTEFELENGIYTFTEVSAPDKYQVATAITFEVKDGKVTVKGTEVSGNTVVMVDKLIEVAKTKVNFSKKALTENGKELAGATIKLTKEDGSIVKEWTTDGSVTEFELENGIYTFTEVSAPDKYQVATAITFEVKDGKVNVKGTEVSGNTVVMVDQLKEAPKTKVNFSKKALTENGKELAGATIKLTKEDGSIVKEWTTDGSVTEFELENGIYTFTEVSAPDKYQVATAITFEVKDGKVTVKGTEVSGNTVVMVDKLIEVAKTKVNFSKKALTENGKELAGATIKLTKEDGSIVKEWTTDGNVTEFELEDGIYTFTEVSAPDKYQVATAITFEVKDGKVNVKGTEVSGNTVVMVDKLIEVAKTKVNFSKKALTENGKELAGATIKLTKEDGSIVKEWTTDGNVTEFELENGIYTFTEVSAPDKYQVATAITFEVKDGKVNVKGTEVSGNTVVMVDKLIEVAKTKVNFSKKALTENGKELAGATIKLTKEDGSIVKEWTTDGSVTEFELENGIYTFTEVSAPDKYQVATAITFEVKDGKVNVKGTEVSGNTVVMVDQLKEAPKTKVNFSKKALTENGKELAGATIKLTKEDGSIVKEWTTDGSVTEFELENGIYTFTEVSAPDKYQVATAITFEVKDGKVTVKGTEVSGNTLVMVDKLKETHTTQKTKVSFSKKALTENGEELAGATINLTKEDGSLVKEWVTDGSVTEFELEDGIYTFTEVSAPDKYQVATAITFEVKDGKVTIKGTEVSGNTLVMVDKLKETHTTQKTKVSFSKKALTENGEELAGATINLTKEDGSLVKEWVTDGSVTEFELEDGIYTFTEVSAPDKYQVATAITFEVKDGKVTIKGTEVSGNTLVMVDQLKEAPKTKNEPKDSINKQDKLSKTGYGTNLSLYVGLILISGSMLILLGNKRRKNEK